MKCTYPLEPSPCVGLAQALGLPLTGCVIWGKLVKHQTLVSNTGVMLAVPMKYDCAGSH